MPVSGSILGNAVRRLEDPALLTGAGKFVDDLVEPNTAHMAFVRSTAAHANLGAVDVAEALSMPGVVAVYHAGGDDLGLPSLQQFPMMPETLNRPVFASEKVRFVGDIVAAVVATTCCPRSRNRSTPCHPMRRCCSPSTVRMCASARASRRRATPIRLSARSSLPRSRW